jgi:hypothetical protein
MSSSRLLTRLSQDGTSALSGLKLVDALCKSFYCTRVHYEMQSLPPFPPPSGYPEYHKSARDSRPPAFQNGIGVERKKCRYHQGRYTGVPP